MKNNLLSENLSELGDLVKSYIEARISLWKVLLVEKLTKIGTYFLTMVSIMMFVIIAFMFSAFAFSYWYGNTYGRTSEGFLISAGFFVILTIVIFIFRRSLFSNNIVKNIASIIFSDNEK